MNPKKFLTGTLVGGLAFFFLGYLIYGMALMNFMASHAGSATGVQRSMEEFAWWALILGNLASAALLSYIFLKWANVNSFGGGAAAAAVVGFFTSMSFDMVMFATSNLMDLTAVVTDIIAFTIMNAIAGGAIGAVLGMGSKS
jgi:hypothetical protein